MSQELIDRIVAAVLYEGYILYPYRPSTKNHQRWTFGGLYPRESKSVRDGADSSKIHVECLLVATPQAQLEIELRFLQPQNRQVARRTEDSAISGPDDAGSFEMVESLRVDSHLYQLWQEAVEQRVEWNVLPPLCEVAGPLRKEFSFPAEHHCERLDSESGVCAGQFVRDRAAIRGVLELQITHLEADLYQLTLEIENTTSVDPAENPSRSDKSLYMCASTHVILHAKSAEFISLIEPADHLAEAVAKCRNVGCFPVLVGEPPQRDTLLCAPIILYDYPQVAPESPVNLFDSTEIDEILMLRIMTLTEEEKREMATLDRSSGALLRHAETLAPAELSKLHGTFRDLQARRLESES